jgi:two-component system, LytTR family, sensor kinase
VESSEEFKTKLMALWQRRSVKFGLLFLVWVIIGLSYAVQAYLFYMRGERPMRWGQVFFREFPLWCIWALFSIPILRLSERLRIGRQNWRGRLFLHVLAGIFFSLAHLSLSTLYLYYGYNWIESGSYINPQKLLWGMFIWNFQTGIVVYWLLIIISHALHYYYRYREREMRAAQLEAYLAQAQLQALKMQLQPHFLFNTLNSISALIHKDSEAADKMVTRLGDFLRLTLKDSGAQEVTLQQELDFLKCYLEIERIRFQDRLTVDMEIEPETVNARLPNLILQPIVENAIRHGIATRIAPGHIEIRTERKNGLLRTQVKDNGPGLQLDANSGKLKEGVGLANTRVRLERLYGQSHRFELANAPEGGLVVTLEIPFVTESISIVENGHKFND